MRTIKNIPHPEMNITVLMWNNKYLIKCEAGPYEQVYKVDASAVVSEDDLTGLISEEFLEKVKQRFLEMNSDFGISVLKNL